MQLGMYIPGPALLPRPLDPPLFFLPSSFAFFKYQSQSPVITNHFPSLHTSAKARFSATSLVLLLRIKYLIILAVRYGESGSPELVALTA